MLKKSLIAILALLLVFSPIGNIKPAQAQTDTDALVETILKAAASAAAAALAKAAVVYIESQAEAEVTLTAAAAAETVAVPVTGGTGGNLLASQKLAEDKTNRTQGFLEWAEEFARTVIQKVVLDVVVDQIITYIQGGGKPQFVTDWQGFLEDAGQRAGGEFVESLGAGFLCEPFSLQLQIAVGGSPKKFSEEAACTLDKIVGNIEDFTNDFRNGGWLAYGESWKFQNNFLGSLITAQEKLGRTEEAAVIAQLNEAISGDGFLSSKKCEKDTKNPQAANMDKDAAGLEQQAIAMDSSNPGAAQGFRSQAAALRQQAATLRGKTLQSSCKVVTPGSTLGDLTSKALGSDIDFLLSADQLGDYVGAIVDALLNRVIEEGLAAARKE